VDNVTGYFVIARRFRHEQRIRSSRELDTLNSIPRILAYAARDIPLPAGPLGHTVNRKCDPVFAHQIEVLARRRDRGEPDIALAVDFFEQGAESTKNIKKSNFFGK